MRLPFPSSRLIAGAAVVAVVLSACGGDDGSDPAAASPTAGDAVAEEPSEAPDDGDAGGVVESPAGVDLGSEAVDPASDTPTNPFPDLVVDDVRREKKVNLRNLLPSEQPVLVWMWAPH